MCQWQMLRYNYILETTNTKRAETCKNRTWDMFGDIMRILVSFWIFIRTIKFKDRTWNLGSNNWISKCVSNVNFGLNWYEKLSNRVTSLLV